MTDDTIRERARIKTDETLISAARRVVRFFNIDNTRGGGLISNETSGAVETLDRMWRKEQDKVCPPVND